MLPPVESSAAPERAAVRYAQQLLQALGLPQQELAGAVDEHPALSWAGSGLMALTGRSDGAPQMLPAPLAACADGALLALQALAPGGALAGLRGSRLLSERAALSGHRRAGAASPGGGCRLLATADGHLAVSLARDDDWALLPAWLETGTSASGDWAALAAAVRGRRLHDLVERGRLLGLAVAPSVPTPSRPLPWHTVLASSGAARPAPRRAVPRVLDLSSLWAGPLCGHLLQRLGAEVVKVESLTRPDGARRGTPEFFDLLNAGKRCVALDLATPQGRARLRALIGAADIVIEASRPRALRQLGIDAAALVAEHPRLTWIGISGYGRGEPQEQWVAFGDDAGVAAGLSYLLRQVTGETLFAGDAIADPLTGLHAALAAWAGYRRGGAGLVSLALVDVVRHVLQFERPASVEAACERQREWTALVARGGAHDALPPPRRPAAPAGALGADTAAVLADWNLAC